MKEISEFKYVTYDGEKLELYTTNGPVNNEYPDILAGKSERKVKYIREDADNYYIWAPISMWDDLLLVVDKKTGIEWHGDKILFYQYLEDCTTIVNYPYEQIKIGA